MLTYPIPLEAEGCIKCPLSQTRNKVVWGTGHVPGKIMLVGEAPGYYEDQSGSPFVGKAGKHLDGLLAKAGISRDDVYITNRVKCRPPQNRDPMPKEREACFDWLTAEIEVVQPRAVLLLGRTAATMAFPGAVMRDIRGVLRSMTVGGHTAAFMATYHPAAALRQGEIIDRLIIEDLEYVKGLI